MLSLVRWITPLLAALLLAASCGLTVTNERPAYMDLDEQEKNAVDIILRELAAFNSQVKSRTPYNIDEIVDKERISVSFEGLIFTGNIGDNIIHVATWENLAPAQQDLVAGWFSTTAASAEPIYKKLFYEFMAVVQGGKQFMYKVLTPAWLFDHRTLFNIERDSMRTALAHYVAVGRKNEIWPFLSSACQPVKAQFGATYSANFNKVYLADHLTELADPANPSGYMYFICRWIEQGMSEAEDLTLELNWLRDLPLP